VVYGAKYYPRLRQIGDETRRRRDRKREIQRERERERERGLILQLVKPYWFTICM
jgi:hypothetical protein